MGIDPIDTNPAVAKRQRKVGSGKLTPLSKGSRGTSTKDNVQIDLTVKIGGIGNL
jgi:hypothetical protein